MQRLAAYPLVYEFSRRLEPRARIEPGETILMESEDALSGQIRATGDRRDKRTVPYSNPVCGPVWVAGAEPGDALAVKIEDIRPARDCCSTYIAPPRQLSEWLGADVPPEGNVYPIRDGQVHFSDRVTIPLAPMLGCIGTAPDWGSPTTGPAGVHGGNLDIVEARPGSTVFLPVFVPGGYLYLGDAHAAMGHGEVSGCGLEMAAETRVTVDLLKGKTIPGPRIETEIEIMAIATGCPMERSLAQATAWLIQWMEAEYGWDRWRAYDLLTHVGQASIGYYAAGTVAMKILKSYAERAG